MYIRNHGSLSWRYLAQLPQMPLSKFMCMVTAEDENAECKYGHPYSSKQERLTEATEYGFYGLVDLY